MQVDLNCDLGEGIDLAGDGADAELMSQVTSVNIACGFHAGDHSIMQQTVRAAKQAGVSVGAHPGYADMLGFGRRNILMSADDLRSCVLYQIGALYALVKAEKMSLAHVKPHGALYNMAAENFEIAMIVGEAIKSFDSSLIYCGLAGSQMAKAAETLGLPFASEVFADRSYQPNGTLLARVEAGAVIADADAAAARVLAMVGEGRVVATDGSELAIKADTVCVHGDSPEAVAFAVKIKAALVAQGIELAPMAECVKT